ncbi:hypothetical protein FNH22_25310 [Fulvivirga sp. M361]|uniref:hypothetical protein n=1 Tax=Fulvivirga sp. M361 TaxID=2594266 RepID=UPI00117A68EF|nr:hypothetical protein [Fulvivirga sp. M361]TRX50643.1 hypothetical protein FNH22_25310 [Fulvivirga sp. M361]
MLRILIPVLFSALILACRSGNQDKEVIAQEATPEEIAESQSTDDDVESNQKFANKSKPTGLTHTINGKVLKIFNKEDTTVIYERPYDGEVMDHGGDTSFETGLYYVHLIIGNYTDLIVICEPHKKGALLEINIPDSVSARYEDFLSGGIHSRSPSGNLMALDFGTGSDRQLRIYALDTKKEIADINYNAVYDPVWDEQERLIYYGGGHLPESLLTAGEDNIPSGTDNVEGVYTNSVYEKIWDSGKVSYTGKYVKMLEE